MGSLGQVHVPPMPWLIHSPSGRWHGQLVHVCHLCHDETSTGTAEVITQAGTPLPKVGRGASHVGSHWQ